MIVFGQVSHLLENEKTTNCFPILCRSWL